MPTHVNWDDGEGGAVMVDLEDRCLGSHRSVGQDGVMADAVFEDF